MMARPMVKIWLRQIQSHILRTILLVFGIALVVSGVVAIDIAKTSVSRSFELSTSAMTSRSTHQIMGNNFRVPQSFFTQLRTDLGIHRSAPVITRPVSVNELDNTSLNLMGIDPFSEMYFRDISIRTQSGNGDKHLSALLDPSSGVLLSRAIAARNGLNQGDNLTLTFGARQVPVVISGLLDSSDTGTNAAFLKGILAGIASAAAAAFFPALTAAATLPITLMHRSAAESALKKHIPQLTIAGSLILGAAVLILMKPDVHPGYDFAGVFLIFLGAALLSPMAILLMVRTMAIMAKPSAGVLTKMALRNIVRSLSRTSVLIASLMVVTSVYIGIDIMTESFRLSIVDWVDGHIGGDIHVSSSDHLNRSLNPDLLEKIQALPAVSAVSAYTVHRIFSRTSGEVHIFSYISDLSKKQWTWTAQGQENVAPLFDQGWIVVSEIFALRNKIHPARGVPVMLETIKGPIPFKIAGIFRDFFMGGGRIIVNRDAMDRFWGHRDITAMQIFLKPKQPIATVMEDIRSFGWTYDMVLSPGVFVQAVSLACLAAVVAGIFPAAKAGRTDIGNALRME